MNYINAEIRDNIYFPTLIDHNRDFNIPDEIHKKYLIKISEGTSFLNIIKNRILNNLKSTPPKE